MATFGRVIPLLVYDDIQAAHDFLVTVFGFTAGTVTRDEGGHPVHGEVHAGETTIWLHRATAEHHLRSASSGFAGSGLVVSMGISHAFWPLAHALRVSPSTNPTASASTPYATVKITDGGSPHQRRFDSVVLRG